MPPPPRAKSLVGTSSISQYCIRVEARGLPDTVLTAPNANDLMAKEHPIVCTPVFGDVVIHTDRHEEVLARSAILESAGQIADSAALAAMSRVRNKRSLGDFNH